MPPPQDKDAIWHGAAFGTKLNQKKKKSYKNTVQLLFSIFAQTQTQTV